MQVHVEGVIRESEKPSSFVPENSPTKGEWYWVDVPAMARAAGLPPDTPLIEASPLFSRALQRNTSLGPFGKLWEIWTRLAAQAVLPCIC